MLSALCAGRRDCQSDSECPSRMACINAKCVNPCEEAGPCGKGGVCNVLDTTPVRTMICECPPGYEGNAVVECTPGKILHLQLIPQQKLSKRLQWIFLKFCSNLSFTISNKICYPGIHCNFDFYFFVQWASVMLRKDWLRTKKENVSVHRTWHWTTTTSVANVCQKWVTKSMIPDTVSVPWNVVSSSTNVASVFVLQSMDTSWITLATVSQV